MSPVPSHLKINRTEREGMCNRSLVINKKYMYNYGINYKG